MSALTSFKPSQPETLNVSLAEVEYLDQVHCAPAAYYQNLPPDHVRAWCSYRGFYGVPTLELILWLNPQLQGKRAIEVGSGGIGLGRFLGVTMTDSYQQVRNPETILYMLEHGQRPTCPADDVIEEDAETAVRKRKPDVVVASWLTQKWLPGDAEGNMHGPREEYILERCSTYIHIGNENIHGKKRLLKFPHETDYFPWLVSRAKDQSKNVIYVWHNPKPFR